MYIEDEVNLLKERLEDQSNLIQVLSDRLTELSDKIDQVEKVERKIYYVADLADLLSCSIDHVRKAYINSGKVKAFKGIKGFEIDKDEFMRVKSTVETRGRHYL